MAAEVAREASEGDSKEPTTSTATALATVAARSWSKETYKKAQLEDIINRDFQHSSFLIEEQAARTKLYARIRGATEDYKKARTDYRNVFTPARLYGEGYNGYGNGHTDAGPPRIVYPASKHRPGDRKAPKLRIPRKDMQAQADELEELVPIRLEVDYEKIKLRDTFTWNLHDRTINQNLFAQHLVEDFGLPLSAGPNPVLDQVQQQMEEQINDHHPAVFIDEEALDPELPYSAYKNDEMRIWISLNITIGTATLEDKFEWDINNPMNSPEDFARTLATDLSLSGEFITAIAHSIREQSQLFIKSLWLIGHPFDGRPIDDADLVASMLPSPMPSTLRPAQAQREYGPIVYDMREEDIEKSEKIYSREQRRQKRSVNRRGGPALPDVKDRPRTVKTRIISSVLLDSAQHSDPNPVYKRVGSSKKRAGLRDELSESSEDEESGLDSPAIPAIQQGTARTRTMRGAATQAQQRMANLGRSETPEALLAHHHETRTSARRFGGNVREESVDNPTLILKLKVGKAKLKKWSEDLKSGIKPTSSQQTTSHARPSPAAPVVGSMGPPPTTPGHQAQSLPPATTPGYIAQVGRVDADPPTAPGQQPAVPPSPPAWLAVGLTQLLTQYPNDRFEGMMRHSSINKDTDMPCPAPPSNQPIPANIKWMYLPRIRCHDCPGKLYTPGPGTTVENFEVHLKNRQHRERVDARVAGKADSQQYS